MKFLIYNSKDKFPVFMGLTLEEFDRKTAVYDGFVSCLSFVFRFIIY